MVGGDEGKWRVKDDFEALGLSYWVNSRVMVNGGWGELGGLFWLCWMWDVN